MNDVEKTSFKRKNSGKRLRRRKRMMSIYVFIVIVLVITAGITMCFTFLFNVDSIVVSGESENYSSYRIVEVSGINAGDNLIRLDTKKAQKKILDELLYVEEATVHKDYPSTIKINVTRCIPAYNIRYDEGVLLVSRRGKVLSDSKFYTDIENLPIIYGYDPKKLAEGDQLVSENKNKNDAFEQLISRFDRDDNSDIASIDLSNEYDIIVTYRDGMVFRMGNWSDVDYKLDLAQNVMTDEHVEGKTGYLTMVGKNQCSFRSNGEIEAVVPTEAPTDSFGNIVTDAESAETADIQTTQAEIYGF